ncbi:MAG: aceF [Planctomycetaceae bacterium]|nr:aceF [Planctomycetaceae bacterium]
MPIEFKLPNLGEGIKSADVAGISVKEGDVIEPNQNVLELETDKAVVELPCATGGKLLQIHVKQGQTVTPGTLLFTLEGNGAATAAPAKQTPAPAPAAAAKPAAAATSPAKPAPAPAPAPNATAQASKPAASSAGGTQVFNCPNLGEGIKSADVSSISVKVGDTITANQNVMELETDKAVVELPCSIAGKITQVHVAPGAMVKPGSPLLTLTTAASAPVEAAAPAPEADKASSVPAAPAKPAPAARTAVEPTSPAAVAVAPVATPAALVPANEKRAPAPAGPATRRLARQLGVDLYQIAGSGPGGRIVMDDVQAYVRQIMEGSKTAPNQTVAPTSKVATPTLPDFKQFGTIERKAMNRIAKTTAANLSYAWQTIPHVTQHDLADVTELEAGRKRHTTNQKTGAKITMTVLAIKAVVAALKQYPNFNSSIDTVSEEIILKQYYHVGVAVDTEFGLVVPVIRDVNHKSILEIAAELDSLASKARERKLSPSDFQGGTFTITNLGGIGGTSFSPIVNWPEVAILGMSRAKQQLVVMDGEPKVRLMLPLSLSYDHRVINGADAARFITKVSGLLADPSQLLIES